MNDACLNCPLPECDETAALCLFAKPLRRKYDRRKPPRFKGFGAKEKQQIIESVLHCLKQLQASDAVASNTARLD